MKLRTYERFRTPVEQALARRRRRRGAILLLVIVAVAGWLAYRYFPRGPVAYEDVREHFKYGSIGSDTPANGLPLEVIKILPRAFPQYMPEGAAQDYTAFGFIIEEGREMPIGFSERHFVIPLTGLNCAVCHVGTVRASVEDEPRTYLGMPAHTVNLEAFLLFLFRCASDQRFTAEHLLPFVEQETDLGLVERLVYRRRAIPQLRRGLLAQQDQLAFVMDPQRPRAGPGRVDTFNPYKAVQYRFPMDHLPFEELIGTADFPSLWNQGPRRGMNLHWDGNNSSVRERNLSAAFGAGALPATVDISSIERIEKWMEKMPPPEYPFAIDASLAEEGRTVYRDHCYGCHGLKDFGPGSAERRETRIGRVEPLEEIGTDPYRLLSFTPELSRHQATLMAGTEHRLTHFRVTNGYANMPLDGIWLRAPYLHNGSVPTLWDLLQPAERRPEKFARGYDVYDQKNVGFVASAERDERSGRAVFQYIVRKQTEADEGEGSGEADESAGGDALPGNSNAGHEYGMDLPEPQKWQLIEFLKTL